MGVGRDQRAVAELTEAVLSPAVHPPYRGQRTGRAEARGNRDHAGGRRQEWVLHHPGPYSVGAGEASGEDAEHHDQQGTTVLTEPDRHTRHGVRWFLSALAVRGGNSLHPHRSEGGRGDSDAKLALIILSPAVGRARRVETADVGVAHS